MSPVEKILPYERDLFLWLNEHHTTYWDTFMWIYSDKLTWLPLAIVALFVFIYKVKWQEALLLLLCAGFLGFFADYVSASFIKPFFERLRPSHHPDFEAYVDLVKGYKGGSFGFISNHAANGFAIVTFTSFLFKYRYYTITILIWALITSYSRIYLGVHFISDIIGGALWGILIGCLTYYIYLCARFYLLKVSKDNLHIPVYSTARANVLIATISVLIFFIAVYSGIFDIPE